MSREPSQAPNQPRLNGPVQHPPDRLDRFIRHWAVMVFMLAAVLFYLLAEHRLHFFGALPWLLILACPLVHIFMHGGHDHSSGKGKGED